jgi:hypothetical protein
MRDAKIKQQDGIAAKERKEREKKSGMRIHSGIGNTARQES